MLGAYRLIIVISFKSNFLSALPSCSEFIYLLYFQIFLKHGYVASWPTQKHSRNRGCSGKHKVLNSIPCIVPTFP
jgi:hypothetical protein